jgi:uncharacterized membrane protein
MIFVPVALAIALVNTNSARATQPSFTALAELPPGLFYTLPYDISADGSVVVGTGSTSAASGDGPVFRWTRETGMVGIGASNTTQATRTRVSADGSTIVGRSGLGAWHWTADTGAVPVPLNANLSGDGAILVGSVQDPNTFQSQAARWTEAGGVELLPTVGIYPYGSSAYDISADGSITLGIGNKQSSSPSSEPFLWSATDGVVPIGLPGGPGSLGRVDYWRISDNGRTVVGNYADASNAIKGLRWTIETGAVELGLLPDGLWMHATSVSADGSIVVGHSQINGADFRPAIWDAIHGPRYLDDVLVNEYGLGEALAGWTLISARGISGDGRSIIGRGARFAGDSQAWIAYLGSTSSLTADYNHDGIVNAADYVVWRKNGGTQSAYNDWRSHFGQSSGSGAGSSTHANAPIPEPSCFRLVALGLMGLSYRRDGRHHFPA